MALTGLTNLQPLHIKTVGIGTFDNTVSIGGTLTYEDVTNVDAIGIITARSGINVSGGQLDVGSNIKLGNAGVITATSFVGDGSGLTGAGPSLTNGANDRIITATGANALQGESNLTFDGQTLTISAPTNDTPLIVNTGSSNGSHLRFQKDGANKHFIGSGGGIGLGDIDDLSLRTVDNMIFGVGTSEKVRINSSGNVGVGTNNPTNKLSVCNGGIKVFGAATPNINFSPVHGNSGNADVSFDGNDLKIISNSSSANVRIGAYSKLTHFVIKANGRIGIGTDNPSNSSSLHIYSTTFDPYLRIGSGARDCGITLHPNSSFNVLRSDAANRLWVNSLSDSIRFTIGGDSSTYEKVRITSDGYMHLGNTGHGTNAVGGQAITGQNYDPRFKIYNTTASSWLMHLRNDVSTNPNGIFMRAGNASTNYSMYITGGDESKPHLVARGDQRVGIGTSNPRTTLCVGGSINAGTINTPFQRLFSKTDNHQRATKHYFRCVRGSTTIFDIVTVDLNQNFHQAICKVFYGTRLQGVSDNTTQVNEIIFGINRFIGNTPTRNRTVIHQDTNSANHANIDVVITSSTQYRVRLTFSGSTSGSSFAGGYVELIAIGSGGDGAFYSLAHSHGINN